MKKNNAYGFSLVELMIGVGILGVSIVVYIGSSDLFFKKNKSIQESVIISNYVNGIYNNIQSNLDLYQVSYNSKKFYEMTSPEELKKNLPIAWDSTKFTDKANCPECPGRMGHILEPVNGYRGLYKLTIRVIHPKIEGFMDYTMLLVGK